MSVQPGEMYGGEGFPPRVVIAVQNGKVFWLPVYVMDEDFFLETSGPLMNPIPDPMIER
jgi:hypothetical protein